MRTTQVAYMLPEAALLHLLPEVYQKKKLRTHRNKVSGCTWYLLLLY